MTDSTYLTWPFFSEANRKLARELELWAAKTLGSFSESGDEDRDARKLVELLGGAGILRHSVPAAYGGASDRLEVRSLCIGREILARYSGLADYAFAMQGLGSGPISLFGSEELKRRYLPGVAKGELIATFALSEAGAGSDAASIETSASLKGSEYILRGSKTWISNTGLADFYVVFARTGEAPGAKGISAFAVDASSPGFKVSARIKITSPHPLGSISLDDCRIPKAALIGRPGEGFKVAMATLDVFRASVGAAALGFARRAFDEALAHCRGRQVFGQALSGFQMTQARLADMAVTIDAAALLVYRAAWAKDSGAERVTREASMAKLFATDQAQRVIDDAVQLLGGKGVVHDSVVERLYRDIRPLRIYEGTSEIQKLVIANQLLKAAGGDN